MGLPHVPDKTSYSRHLCRIEDEILDCEHFRGFLRGNPCNIAVIVMKDGRCFIGQAVKHHKDQYSRKRGHEIAVGRALKAASTQHPGDFQLNGEKLEGRALRDFCRGKIQTRAEFRGWVPAAPSLSIIMSLLPGRRIPEVLT